MESVRHSRFSFSPQTISQVDMEIEIEIQQKDFKWKMSYPIKSVYSSCHVQDSQRAWNM